MNNIITLPKLAEMLARETSTSVAEAQRFVQDFTAVITEALCNDGSVRIKGLGTFVRTDIAGKVNVTFLPDKEVSEYINSPFSCFEPVELADGVTADMLEGAAHTQAPTNNMPERHINLDKSPEPKFSFDIDNRNDQPRTPQPRQSGYDRRRQQRPAASQSHQPIADSGWGQQVPFEIDNRQAPAHPYKPAEPTNPNAVEGPFGKIYDEEDETLDMDIFESPNTLPINDTPSPRPTRQPTVNPWQENSEPWQEPSRPRQETSKPWQEPSRPRQETSRPWQEPSRPRQETSKPWQEPSRPRQETSQPWQEPSRPRQETSKPWQEPSRPRQETSKPWQEPSRPRQETSQPWQENSQPWQPRRQDEQPWTNNPPRQAETPKQQPEPSWMEDEPWTNNQSWQPEQPKPTEQSWMEDEPWITSQPKSNDTRNRPKAQDNDPWTPSRPQADDPWTNKPQTDDPWTPSRPQTDDPWTNKPQTDDPWTNKPQTDNPRNTRSKTNDPWGGSKTQEEDDPWVPTTTWPRGRQNGQDQDQFGDKDDSRQSDKHDFTSDRSRPNASDSTRRHKSYDDDERKPNIWFWLSIILILGVLIGFGVGYFCHDSIAARYNGLGEDKENYEIPEDIYSIDGGVTSAIDQDQDEVYEDLTDSNIDPNEAPSPAAAEAPVTEPDQVDDTRADAGAPAANAPVVYDTIDAYGSLSQMAVKHYGKSVYWVYIYLENKDKIPDPNYVRQGLKLVIPPKKKYDVSNDEAENEAAAKRMQIEIYRRN